MTDHTLGTTLKGKIAANLLGMACAQKSAADINFATPFADDEGIDLIFFRRGSTGEVLLVQVKSSSTDAKSLQKGVFRASVWRQSFRARRGYYLIFVAVDHGELRIQPTLWLIPSEEFEANTRNQKSPKYLFFQSTFESNDVWKRYRTDISDLPNKIRRALKST